MIGQQNKVLENMEQTMQRKKFELLQTQQENQKEQMRSKDAKI